MHYDDETRSGRGSGGGAGGGGAGGGGAATGAGSAGAGGGAAALWSERFGGSSDERLAGLAVRPDGSILLAGSYRGAPTFGPFPLPDMAFMYQPGPFGVFGASLDETGVPTWAHGGGDAVYDHIATDLALTTTGALVTGWFQGELGFGSPVAAQGSDVFLLELGGSGVEFGRAFGGNGSDHAWAVATAPSGTIVMAGDYDALATFGGF